MSVIIVFVVEATVALEEEGMTRGIRLLPRMTLSVPYMGDIRSHSVTLYNVRGRVSKKGKPVVVVMIVVLVEMVVVTTITI